MSVHSVSLMCLFLDVSSSFFLFSSTVLLLLFPLFYRHHHRHRPQARELCKYVSRIVKLYFISIIQCPVSEYTFLIYKPFASGPMLTIYIHMYRTYAHTFRNGNKKFVLFTFGCFLFLRIVVVLDHCFLSISFSLSVCVTQNSVCRWQQYKLIYNNITFKINIGKRRNGRVSRAVDCTVHTYKLLVTTLTETPLKPDTETKT